MEWTHIVTLTVVGVLLAGVAGAGVLLVMPRIETARRHARLRSEQYRTEAELQHLTQRAMAEMLQTARLDAKPRRPTSPAERATPSTWDIEGEAWDSDG